MIKIGSRVVSKQLLKEGTIGTVNAMVHKTIQLELNSSVYSDGNRVVASGEDVINAFDRWEKLYPGFTVVCWVNFDSEVVPYSRIATDGIFIPLDDLEEVLN